MLSHAFRGKALTIALAVYGRKRNGISQSEHEDLVYAAVEGADLDEAHKAEFYARLAEKLTPTTRLDEAEQIIADALHETWSVTRG